jgi:hypothetical protein
LNSASQYLRKNRWPPTARAESMTRAAKTSGLTTMVDFNFSEVLTWHKASSPF